MGIRFELEGAIPFTRDFLSDIWGKRPLYIRGRTDIFFYGCPCGKDGDIGRMAFQLNLKLHRMHIREKIYELYGILVEDDDLKNGAGHIGGLAEHVQRLHQASWTGKRKAEKEAKASHLQRLQDTAYDLARLGLLRILSSGDIPADRQDRVTRQVE